MKWWKTAIVVCVLWFNMSGMLSAWADAGKFMKTPEYTAVNQAIADLADPDKTSDMTPEAISQKLADLRFQKYVLETSETRSTCRNETGQTLGIYAKSKKAALPTLYFLGAGQTTDDDVECVGIYVPAVKPDDPENAEAKATEPMVTKFVPGTQLIAATDPATGAIAFNVPVSGLFKAGEIDWTIPTLTQADIDSQTPNAPVD